MSTSLFQSEPKFLERARISLTNSQSHAVIKPSMAEYGMDETKIAEGWDLYNKAKDSWELNQKENAEAKIASNTYKKEYGELEAIFKVHRDKTLIFFEKQPEILIRLGVGGRFPTKYRDFFDKTKQYYKAIQDNAEIQAKMSVLKITLETATECLLKHQNLLAKRADYEKESGESQETTKSKNAALFALKEWLDDFDNIAKIALYDKPQLLESLGIFVRS